MEPLIKMYKELLDGDEHDIIGLVSTYDIDDSSIYTPFGLHAFTIEMECIKFESGEMIKKRLCVRAMGDELYVRSFDLPIRGKSTVRLRVKCRKEKLNQETDLLLTAILEKEVSDPDIDNFAELLSRDYFINMAGIGKFKLDREVDWFEKQISFYFKNISLTVVTREDSVALALQEKLFILFKNRYTHSWEARSYAEKVLRDLKNSAWADNTFEKVPPFVFRLRLKLTSISLSNDGNVDYWFDDGGMFYGHSVVVRMNTNGELYTAELIG